MPTKHEQCDMVVIAWETVGEDLIKKSFLVCGQSKNSRHSDIAVLKPGGLCHSALETVERLWEKDIEDLKLYNNPHEVDENEDNFVIEDEVDETEDNFVIEDE